MMFYFFLKTDKRKKITFLFSRVIVFLYIHIFTINSGQHGYCSTALKFDAYIQPYAVKYSLCKNVETYQQTLECRHIGLHIAAVNIHYTLIFANITIRKQTLELCRRRVM